jgi:hypothetical protein
VTRAEIVAELAGIERDLDDADVRLVWGASLFGWKAPAHLAPRVERLRVLRDQVGRDAAARKRGAA